MRQEETAAAHNVSWIDNCGPQGMATYRPPTGGRVSAGIDNKELTLRRRSRLRRADYQKGKKFNFNLT